MDTDGDNENKIIKNISKAVMVQKDAELTLETIQTIQTI
jgi:hypothetical protein